MKSITCVQEVSNLSGQRLEVPCELSGKTVRLVVEPYAGRVVGLEDAAGVSLGSATPLDQLANIQRARRKPEPLADTACTSVPTWLT